MGVSKKYRRGIRFADFRTNEVTEALLPKCGLDDDDIVFLESWYQSCCFKACH